MGNLPSSFPKGRRQFVCFFKKNLPEKCFNKIIRVYGPKLFGKRFYLSKDTRQKEGGSQTKNIWREKCLCKTNPYLHSFVQHERTYTHGKYHQHYERAQLVCDYLGERRWNCFTNTHFGGRRNQFHFYPNRNFLRNFQLYC